MVLRPDVEAEVDQPSAGTMDVPTLDAATPPPYPRESSSVLCEQAGPNAAANLGGGIVIVPASPPQTLELEQN
jgi:hypothetical protein